MIGQEFARRLALGKDFQCVRVQPLRMQGWLQADAPSQEYVLNYETAGSSGSAGWTDSVRTASRLAGRQDAGQHA